MCVVLFWSHKCLCVLCDFFVRRCTDCILCVMLNVVVCYACDLLCEMLSVLVCVVVWVAVCVCCVLRFE